MSFKIGDYVIYTRHVCPTDRAYFIVNQIYKIVDFRHLDIILEGVELYVTRHQIEKLFDCKLNRLLYPEAFRGG